MKKPLTEGQKKQAAYSRKRALWFKKLTGRTLKRGPDARRGKPT